MKTWLKMKYCKTGCDYCLSRCLHDKPFQNVLYQKGRFGSWQKKSWEGHAYNIMQTSYGKAEGIWLYSLQNMKQQNKHTSSVYRSALSNQKLNDNRNAMAERSRATAVPMKWQGE